MIDGEVDYSGLTREEIADVLRNIDAQRFPQNHANALERLRAFPAPTSNPLQGADRASTPPPRPIEPPRKPRAQLLAEAGQWRVDPKVLTKNTLLFVVAVQLAGFLANEVVTIRALAHGEAPAPIGPTSSPPHILAATLVTALLVCIALAKRHPRGYFVTATCIVTLAAAFDLGLMLWVASGAAGLQIYRHLMGLFECLPLVALAGFVTGLMPLPGDRSNEQEAGPRQSP